nr:unnamed protein product [Callosobruchus chinensis]
MAVIALSAILAAVKGGVGLIGAGKIAILPFLIAAMTYFHYDQFDPENRPVDREEVDAWYDFIIIGGGSAGSVLANRLTEIPNWKVLLLEAGGQETEISDVPILSLYLHKSKLDWGYKTEPSDSACQAMIEKRCSWTRGKVLGGSSVLNTMLYIRDPATRRAYGVEFFKNGKKKRVMVRKEVILSAGAINSPHLLMLSGVGPAQHLKEKGVPVIHDSPGVGKFIFSNLIPITHKKVL